MLRHIASDKLFLSPEDYNNFSKGILAYEWSQEHADSRATHRTIRYLLRYLPPVLLLAGTIGNILAGVVLSTREMSRHPTSSYLVALSIADTAVLYLGLFRFWLAGIFGLNHLDKSDAACKIINFTNTTASNLSAWLLVAVTVDRYLGICQPIKARASGASGRFSKIVIWTILFFFLLLNLHFFWTVSSRYFVSFVRLKSTGLLSTDVDYQDLWHWKKGSWKCRLEDTFWASKVWPWIDMILYSFLPFALLLTFNAFIIRAITLSRRFVRSSNVELQSYLSLTKSGSSKVKKSDSREKLNTYCRRLTSICQSRLLCDARTFPEGGTSENSTPPGSSKKNLTAGSSGETRRFKLDSSTRLSFMLLVVSLSYILLTLPMSLMMIAAAFLNDMVESVELGEAKQIEASFGLGRAIAEMLMYSNHAINFYLYCLTGTAFRHRLKRLVCFGTSKCCKSRCLPMFKSDECNVGNDKFGQIREQCRRSPTHEQL